MYISSFTITKDHRCFKQGESYDLRPLTILVGDQGCGKSTLLDGLQEHRDFLSCELIDKALRKGVKSFYFDSEKMNPRLKDPAIYTTPAGKDRGIGFKNALVSRFASHGEIMVNFTVECFKKASESVIIVDEPESGLSLRNQFKLWNEIQNAVNRKCQVLVATHSLVLIQGAESVLSLEHKRWMSSEEFIHLNK